MSCCHQQEWHFSYVLLSLGNKPHQCWFVRLFPSFFTPLPLPFWITPTYLYCVYLTLAPSNYALARIHFKCGKLAEPKRASHSLYLAERHPCFESVTISRYLLGKIHHRCQTPHQYCRNLRVWDGGYWKGNVQSKPAYLLFCYLMNKLDYLYFRLLHIMNKQLTTTKEKNPTGTVQMIERVCWRLAEWCLDWHNETVVCCWATTC